MSLPADVVQAAQLRVMAARIVAQGRWPYLASLLFSLRIVPVDAEVLPTMAVDSGWRMYYNPEFVLAEGVDALATVLLHEAMHCMLAHAVRYDAIDSGDGSRLVWNLAGDCSINETLDEARMPWTTSVTPVRLQQFRRFGLTAGMTTEAMYLALMEKIEEVESTACDCGSAADRVHRDYELPAGDGDSPAAGRAQQETVIDRVASDILAAARSQGSVPAGLLRWAEEHLDPTLDWRRILGVRLRRAVASVAGRRDYTYTRPSRRQGAMRQQGLSVVLPAMRQPAPPRVAIVVDTSGSISAEDLRQYVGEVAGIVRSVGVSQGVWVIPCDAKAGRVQRLRSMAAVDTLEFTGGGGTDMGAGIEAALLIRPRPQVVVVITDGYTPWPAERPRELEHGIVVLSDDSQRSQVPTWLDSLVIG